MIAYSTNRPIGMGTWPSQHREKVVGFHHFDRMTYVPEIGRTSFGYIEFSEDIPKADLDAYELVVPMEEDGTLQRVVSELMRSVDDDDRFDKVWEIAKRRHGYTDDELDRAFGRACAAETR